MKFHEYQNHTSETAVFPEDEGIRYCTLGLAGEAGECAEKVKKWRREEDPKYLLQLEDEIGDVLWYVAQLCEQLDIEMEDVAYGNVKKLKNRQDRDVLTGQGDDR